MRVLVTALLSGAALCAHACAGPAQVPATTGPAAVAPASPAPPPVDTTPGWTATDTEAMLQGFATQCLTDAAWVGGFTAAKRRKPVVRMSTIINKTGLDIDAGLLVDRLEQALLASGSFEVAAAHGAERDAVRQEQDLAIASGDETGPHIGMEKAADFVLTLRLNRVSQAAPAGELQLMGATLKIVNVETAEMACAAMVESRRLVVLP